MVWFVGELFFGRFETNEVVPGQVTAFGEQKQCGRIQTIKVVAQNAFSRSVIAGVKKRQAGC